MQGQRAALAPPVGVKVPGARIHARSFWRGPGQVKAAMDAVVLAIEFANWLEDAKGGRAQLLILNATGRGFDRLTVAAKFLFAAPAGFWLTSAQLFQRLAAHD
jgi:hypothetical protein